MAACILCHSQNTKSISVGRPVDRRYHHCQNCHLIFVDREFLPSDQEAVARYTQHQNGLHDPGYVSFLKKSLDKTIPFLQPGMIGLDYGCGPSPTLSTLLEAHHIVCDNYDPFFFPENPDRKYDFIFSTECFEHFSDPFTDIKKISALLNTGSVLSIMTDHWTRIEIFPDWYYLRDFTHVSFYHATTFDFIADALGFELLFHDKNRIVVLRKR